MPEPTAHHYHPLVRSLARALKQRCGVTPEASILVACSGGADSVALLRALAMLTDRRKWRLRLIVGHVQHHLRDDAEEDAGFVAELADKLGLPHARRDIHLTDLPGNIEANARRLRYQALAAMASEHGTPFIATAHHADDQLETLLMRILRGTSVAGLRGIAWHKPLARTDATTNLHVIRPMLAVNQDAIHALLDQLGQPFRHDTTNDDTSRTRAKLRHDVLPMLKQLQPDATDKANALVEHFNDLNELVQASADQALQNIDTNQGDGLSAPAFTLPRAEARAMNRVVLSELLRRALIDAGTHQGQLSRHGLLPAVHAAQDQVGGTRTFAFSKGVQLSITRESVTLTKAPS